MKISVYNNTLPWASHMFSAEGAHGTKEMLDVYSPFGQIKNVLSSFRSGIGIGGFQGSATPFSLDHIFRRITGLSSLTVGLDKEIYGGGKGITINNSALSSLGEAVERMLGIFSSLRKSSVENRIKATAREMRNSGYRYLKPEDYQIFSTEQFERAGFEFYQWTEDTALYWEKGTNLVDGGDFWIPSQLVHLLYMPQAEEGRIGGSSSGGLATHYTKELSLAHGILETIERDALNLAWCCKIPLKKIDIDTTFVSKDIERVMQTVNRSDVEIDFYLHQTDMKDFYVVTASSVEKGQPSQSYISGGGVGTDIESAITSAMSELIQAERMIRSTKISPNWELTYGFRRMFTVAEDANIDDFTNFIQVVDFYGFPSNQKKLDWFLRSPDMSKVSLKELQEYHRKETDPAKDLELIINLCKKYRLNPIAFDFTPEGFEQIQVNKVFIPELVPAFSPNLPMVGHNRYKSIRKKIGLSEHNTPDWTVHDMPTDPLPYP